MKLTTNSCKLIVIFICITFLVACSSSNLQMKSIGRSILSVVPGAGYAADYFDAGVDAVSALKPLSQEEEYYLGRAVAAKILSRYKPYQNQRLNRYVSKVGLSLALYSERPNTFSGYHFLVLDSDEINSFAAPSGFIMITRGLLNSLPDEDALAGVLAHEIGHVVAQHGLKSISQSNMSNALLVAGKAACRLNCAEGADQLLNAFDGAVTDVFQTILEKGYGRDQEYEADQLALSILSSTGYSAVALPQTVSNLEQSGRALGGGLFGSHPNPLDRIKKMKRALKGKDEGAQAQALRAERFKQAVRG
jgi:predicted Zn-dependent protease